MIDQLLFALAGAVKAREANVIEAERGALSMVLDLADPELLADWPRDMQDAVVAGLRRSAELLEADGRAGSAGTALRRAVAIYEAANHLLPAAACRQGLIELLVRQRNVEAEVVSKDALARLEGMAGQMVGSPPHERAVRQLEAMAMANLAKLLGSQGRADEAHAANVRAAGIAAEVGDVALEAGQRALSGLGYAIRNEARSAIKDLSRAIELIDSGDRELLPMLLFQRAQMLMRMADTPQTNIPRPTARDRATADYLAAGPLYEERGDARAAANCWYLAGSNLVVREFVERMREGLEEAKRLFERAEGLHRSVSPDAIYVGLTRGQLGYVSWQLGDLEAAERWYRKAAWTFHRCHAGKEKTEALLAASAMQAGQESSSPNSAQLSCFMVTFRRVLRSWERLRREALTTAQRIFEDENVFFMRHVLAKQLEVAWDTPALAPVVANNIWEAEQLTKARDLVDEVAVQRLADDEELREAQRTAAAARARLDEIRLRQSDDLALRIRFRMQRQRLRQEVEVAERAQHDRVQGIQSQDPALSDVVSPKPVSVEDLQQVLGEDEVYLGFLWNGGAPIRLMVSRAGGLTVADVGECTAAPLWQQVKGWVNAARLTGEVPAAGGDLGDVLLAGLPAGVTTMLVCPDGELSNLPWHGLTQNGVRLDEHCVVATVPSASTLVFARTAADAPPPDVAYFGVAENGDGRIPMVDSEVRGVRDACFPGCDVLLSGDSQGLLSTNARVGLLHIACHASRDGLLLANGRVVRPHEFVGLGLAADILLLAGCELGRFGYDEVNRFDGVVRELLVATGARAAIVSSARVRDEVGTMFSQLVVRALVGRTSTSGQATSASGGATVGEAVRRARRELAAAPGAGVARFIPNASGQLSGPDWSLPWYVIGDPRARLRV